MPRNISTQLYNDLSSSTCAVAICIKLTRKDSVILGFTTWDDNIVYDDGSGSITYDAESSFFNTSIQHTVGSPIDNLNLKGAISSNKISDIDILAGKYDNCAIKIFLLNPYNLPAGHMMLCVGNLGEINVENNSYEAEVRSNGQKLSNKVGRIISPLCDVKRLGDVRCLANTGEFADGKTITDYRTNITVVSATDDPQTIVMTGSFPSPVTSGSDTEYYNNGVIRFNTGDNTGIEKEIKTWSYASSQLTIVLDEPFISLPVNGNTGYVEAGCDRLIQTCNDRFANQERFRGEPFLPGLDKMLSRGTG